MEWRQYFPKADIFKEESSDEGIINIELDDGWLQLPLAELSDREIFLLKTLGKVKLLKKLGDSPWESYLLGDNSQLPQVEKSYQFLYVEHSQALSEELKYLLQSMVVGESFVVPINSNQTVLVLLTEDDFDILSLLQEVLVTIENDFGISLKVFLGNRWSYVDSEHLKIIFKAELALLETYNAGHHLDKMQSFSKLMLWGLSHQLDSELIKERLKGYLQNSEDLSDIVFALWENQLNQVKAANSLFLHRNSLQYKIEKFQRLSGLNLKKLDDLALCYLLLMDL